MKGIQTLKLDQICIGVYGCMRANPVLIENGARFIDAELTDPCERSIFCKIDLIKDAVVKMRQFFFGGGSTSIILEVLLIWLTLNIIYKRI